MGVHGLWRLIESSGKPVPLETLENKVLAVDISIWLHQCVKGFQDSRGASVPNAHLLGIYHRLCKLLYFRIKPIFVFDGGVPALKKQTIAKRNQSKLRNEAQADKLQKQLLNILLKHTAVSKVLTDKIEASLDSVSKQSSKKPDTMFALPPTGELDSTVSSSEDESYSETTSDSSPTKNWDLHTIDMDSVRFKTLPADVRHEILSDLKETRKQSSWGRIHELPKVSDDFSCYQMNRLLKRQAVQSALEEAEKEMGGKCLSLGELESVLKDEGIITNEDVGNRIASDNVTKYVLVKDLKKATEEVEQTKISPEDEQITDVKEDTPTIIDEKTQKSMADLEYEDDLQRAIALSLEEDSKTSGPSNSGETIKGKVNPADFSFLESFTDADFQSSSSDEESKDNAQAPKATMSSVQGYMLEYSGLTISEINKIMNRDMEDKISKKKVINRKNLDVIVEDEEVKSITDKRDIEKSPIATNEASKNENAEDEENIEFITSSDASDREIDTKSENHMANSLTKSHSDVEFMSSSESSDSDEPSHNSRNQQIANGISINIHPTDTYNEADDLFNDIFSSDDKVIDNVLPPNTTNSEIDKQKTEIAIEVNNKGEEQPPVEQPDGSVDQNNEAPEIIIEPDKPYIDEVNKDVGNQEPEKVVELKTDTPKESAKKSLTEKELITMKNELHRQKIDVLIEKSTKDRMAGNITDQMYQEAQELLELFGVPYMVAPMEAEAQCAFLEQIDLTNGTITDDSDIWLFGAKKVYKNFFNQNKYVKEFHADDIKHHFKLTREQLILLALLVGSDYTVGLQGVGPVTALEILSTFPAFKTTATDYHMSQNELLSGLKEFKSWFTKGKSSGAGRNSLKSKLRNITFTDNFPSLQVVQAYLEPTVETSNEPFSWGKPDASLLTEYARIKFGWTRTKTEEILQPVMKRLAEVHYQKTIKDYFKSTFKIHSGDATSNLSKRVKSAITNMGRDPSEIIAEELEEELKKQQGKRPSTRNTERTAPEFNKKKSRSKLSNEETVKNKEENKTTQKSRKRGKESQSDVVNLKKLKPQSVNEDKEESDTVLQANEVSKDSTADNNDISEKINKIRKRRVLQQVKASVDARERKAKKEKVQRKKQEPIPECLAGDEEVSMLSQVLKESQEKAKEISKAVRNELKMLEVKSLVSSSSTASNKPKPNIKPTMIPRKELIPQKEKDKNTLLRNKLKAIETFRKGKKGPGYVPKTGQKKRLPKADADLSESSD